MTMHLWFDIGSDQKLELPLRNQAIGKHDKIFVIGN